MDSIFLKADNIILQACVSIAQNNGHGHMTSNDVMRHLHTKNIQRSYSRLVSYLSEQKTWWRQGVERRTRGGCLIRELRESIWNSTRETDINSLRYQLKQANKHLDALKIKYERATVRANDHLAELQKIRYAWRGFQNLMQDRR